MTPRTAAAPSDDAAAALANPAGTLQPFEGKAVLRAAIEIPNAAGGLREAMKFEPREFHHGEQVFVVLRCSATKVRFDPVPKAEENLVRVHVLNAEEATFIDGAAVESALVEQRNRISRLREEAAGIARLPYGDELQEAHDAGMHADGLVENCPSCDAEAAAQ